MPERLEKTYLQLDWRISVTGVFPDSSGGDISIPAYYCDECGEMVVSKKRTGEMPEMRLHPYDTGSGYSGYLVLFRIVAIFNLRLAG